LPISSNFGQDSVGYLGQDLQAIRSAFATETGVLYTKLCPVKAIIEVSTKITAPIGGVFKNMFLSLDNVSV
jgi:hypothetical protein